MASPYRAPVYPAQAGTPVGYGPNYPRKVNAWLVISIILIVVLVITVVILAILLSRSYSANVKSPVARCTSSLNCQRGQVCNTSTRECVQCVVDANCPAGKFCRPDIGTCVECVHASDCPTNYACAVATGTCVPN